MRQLETRTRWRVPTSVWVVCVILLLGAAWFLNTYATPEGMWNVPQIGNEGYSYIEVRDGKIELAIEESGRELLGTYHRSDRQWVGTTMDGIAFRLVASPLELRLIETNGTQLFGPINRLFLRPNDSPPVKVKVLK